ncbi:MAG: DUF2269 family protein [Gemmatimonadetes bacterium]|nr:DUF2269 family protein [Gemmatimonadota bacterium]
MGLKFLHVLSAILLVGNVIVTGVWATILWREHGAKGFGAAAKAIIYTDLVFTFGASLLLVTTGVFRAYQLGLPIMGTPWIARAIMGLAIATALWAVVLIPAQVTMLRAGRGPDADVERAFGRWTKVGWLAVVPMLYSVWQMVAKPA